MCVMCILIDKESMSPIEIARALTEMDENDKHIEDITDKLEEKDMLEEVLTEYLKIV